MIRLFQNGDTEGVAKLFEAHPAAINGRPGRLYQSDEEQINPVGLLGRAKQELEKHRKEIRR